MKIIIDIPEEFEIDFKNDKFDECFSRIYYAATSSKTNIAGNYELETLEMLRKAFGEVNGVVGEYKPRLIDANDLKEFFFRPESDTEEIINDLMIKHNLDYLHDVNEDDVMDFAKELLKMVCNVIDTQKTLFNIGEKI